MMELGESCDAFNGSSSGGYNKSLFKQLRSQGFRGVPLLELPEEVFNLQLIYLILEQLRLRLE